MLCHVLITRYGLGVYDDEWFDLRYPVLEKITFNSIINQSSNEFYWCIHIDNAMPLKSKQRLLDLTKNHPNIILISQDYWNSSEGIDAVLSRLESNPDFLITTKIDDDDALEQHYVEEINSYVSNNISNIDRPTFIGYPRGYRLDLVTGLAAEELHPSFLFVSCISPLKDKQFPRYTAYSVAHTKVMQFSKENSFKTVLLKENSPMWVYVRHQYADSINPRYFTSQPEKDRQNEITRILENNFGIPLEDLKSCIEFYSGQLGKKTLKTSLLETTHSSLLKQIKDLDKRISQTNDFEEKEKLKLQRSEFLEEYRSIGENVISKSIEDLLNVKSGKIGIRQIIANLEHHFSGVSPSTIQSVLKIFADIIEGLDAPKFNYRGLKTLDDKVFKEASRGIGQVERYFEYAFNKHVSGEILEIHNGFSLKSRIIPNLRTEHTFSELKKPMTEVINSLKEFKDIKVIFTRMFSESGFTSPDLMKSISETLSSDGFLIGTITHVNSDVGYKITPVGINTLLQQFGFEIIKIHSGVDIFTLFGRELARTIGDPKITKAFTALLNDKSPVNDFIEISSQAGNLNKNLTNLIKLHFSGEFHFIAKKI